MLSFKKGENLGINERGKFYFSFVILIFDNVDKILFYFRDKGCLFAVKFYDQSLVILIFLL